MKQYQLSLPGPTETDPQILQAMMRPNLPHYGELWMDLYEGILTKLKQVYKTDGRVLILPCSGSGGLDAVFCSLGSVNGIILSNGTFGMRLIEIAKRHCNRLTVIESDIGVPFDLDQVRDALAEHRHHFLAVVHGETSTGMVNHLSELSELCRKKDILFMVDAVSTLGGLPLDTDRLGIDYCVSASQKAIGALPGLATVAVSEKGWNALEAEEDIHSWYLNIRTWERYRLEWDDWHPYPVTLPIHLFFAFHKALDLLLEEGLEKSWERHRYISSIVQEGLLSMGIPLLIEEKENRLATTTAATLPEGYLSEDLQRFLRERLGILTAGGVGPTRKRVFRIGHMGYSAQEWLIRRVLLGVNHFMSVSGAGKQQHSIDEAVYNKR